MCSHNGNSLFKSFSFCVLYNRIIRFYNFIKFPKLVVKIHIKCSRVIPCLNCPDLWTIVAAGRNIVSDFHSYIFFWLLPASDGFYAVLWMNFPFFQILMNTIFTQCSASLSKLHEISSVLRALKLPGVARDYVEIPFYVFVFCLATIVPQKFLNHCQMYPRVFGVCVSLAIRSWNDCVHQGWLPLGQLDYFWIVGYLKSIGLLLLVLYHLGVQSL